MSFFSTQSQFLQRIADVLLRHVISPQPCHLALGLAPVLFDKFLKALPNR
jgi:hypothetical protein